jgi:mRNA interferase MazF
MKPGEIYYINVSGRGHEQKGTRPAIIVSEPEANTVVVIPCTSNIRALRYPHTLDILPSTKNGLKNLSVALVFQIRAIDRHRIRNKIGVLNRRERKQISDVLRSLLKL